MSFSEISIGHPSIIQKLQSFILHQSFPNALLFYGCSGSGKSFFAHHFIEEVLCQKPVSGRACLQCKSCQLRGAEYHPDRMVVEPDDKQSIKIDTIREMQNFCALKPVYADKKWILIEEAHQLTIESSQALLKNLEEPNSSSRFILTTHHLEGLLPTIRSRCSLIPFYAYSDEEMEQLLSQKTDDMVLVRELAMITKGNSKLAFQLLNPENRLQYENQISLFFEVGDHLYEKLPVKTKDEIIQLLHCWENALLDLIKYGLNKNKSLYKSGAWLIKKFQPASSIQMDKVLWLQQQLIQYEKNLQRSNPYLPSFTQCLLSDIYWAFH